MIPQALACVNIEALRHNLSQVRKAAPDVKILAVIKANAYGHDAGIVSDALSGADAFAVGTIEEAEELRQQFNPSRSIVILQGVEDQESLLICLQHGYEIVVHSLHQIELLETVKSDKKINGWLKMDTGMHRLGLPAGDFEEINQRLSKSNCIDAVTLMSHLACADEPQREENRNQLNNFKVLAEQHGGDKSLCNSAATIEFPQAHYDWVRPGIMLYGISPLQGKVAGDFNLRPAMTLKSRLIAINYCRKGDKIGYGATWECPQDMQIGVVGIGYGDGYPRHVLSGTPVLINGEQVPMVGRVSMDLLTVDLRTLADTRVGDEVVLWGEGLPIETIAEAAGTIGYELVCRLTSRVVYEAVN